ncbi:MAG TPA: 2-oxo-4-hydroxy-4-carboxy-5-ureidoimidazoline decarboxylase [Chloroflexota bacterium]
MPISALNAARRPEFVAALRPLFEAADPLANGLYAARPFTSYEALLDRADVIVGELPRAQQIQVVNAHPRIGASPTEVSQASYREQGYAAEADQDMATVYERLRQLNDEYERRFGFRFVVFVNGRPKAEIADVLQERLAGKPEDELRLALLEMIAIARDRLHTLS